MSNATYPAVAELERQRIVSLISAIDNANSELTRAKGDVESIQDEEVRDEMKGALAIADQALQNFSNAFEFYYDDQIGKVIDYSDADDDDMLDCFEQHKESRASDLASSSGGSGESPALVSQLSMLSIIPPVSTGEGDSEVNDPTHFDRENSPGLAGLADWLDLGDAISVAHVLNSKPVQYAFNKYRAHPGQISCVRAPEALKLALTFFTFSRQSLANWHRSKLDASKRPSNGINFAAALFAHHVVRYLEGSCEEVQWKPVNHETSFEAYDVAKRRFAVALQIFWFLEKTFDLP